MAASDKKFARIIKEPGRFYRTSLGLQISLSAQGVLLRLYQSLRAKVPGLVEFSRVGFADELGFPVGEVGACLDELIAAGIVEEDPTERLFWVPSAMEADAPSNIDVVTGWARHLKTLGRSPLIEHAAQAILDAVRRSAKGRWLIERGTKETALAEELTIRVLDDALGWFVPHSVGHTMQDTVLETVPAHPSPSPSPETQHPTPVGQPADTVSHSVRDTVSTEGVDAEAGPTAEDPRSFLEAWDLLIRKYIKRDETIELGPRTVAMLQAIRGSSRLRGMSERDAFTVKTEARAAWDAWRGGSGATNGVRRIGRAAPAARVARRRRPRPDRRQLSFFEIIGEA